MPAIDAGPAAENAAACFYLHACVNTIAPVKQTERRKKRPYGNQFPHNRNYSLPVSGMHRYRLAAISLLSLQLQIYLRPVWLKAFKIGLVQGVQFNHKGNYRHVSFCKAMLLLYRLL